uniref:Uncharacterized protein n=1 Tax=Anguilla anguilla TaxID=7936 RepID=A0A0E9XUI1_ANGAN
MADAQNLFIKRFAAQWLKVCWCVCRSSTYS